MNKNTQTGTHTHTYDFDVFFMCFVLQRRCCSHVAAAAAAAFAGHCLLLSNFLWEFRCVYNLRLCNKTLSSCPSPSPICCLLCFASLFRVFCILFIYLISVPFATVYYDILLPLFIYTKFLYALTFCFAWFVAFRVKHKFVLFIYCVFLDDNSRTARKRRGRRTITTAISVTDSMSPSRLRCCWEICKQTSVVNHQLIIYSDRWWTHWFR